MTDKIKTAKEKKLEKYLEQSLQINAPAIFKHIGEAKEKDLMLVLESSDMKGETSEALQTIGMIVKYAAMQGVEVRIAPDNSLAPEEK